jgi:hypothetical protein
MPKLTFEEYKRRVKVREESATNEEAAERLSMSPSALARSLVAAARVHGLVPKMPELPVPSGYNLGKLTTQVDGAGNVRMVWARTHPTIQALERVVEELCASVEGKSKPKTKLKRNLTDESCLETAIADLHIGRYAWRKEAGEDYNSKKAIQLLVDGSAKLIQRSPKCNKGLIVSLGDFCHVDNRTGQTERAGNILDYDSRYTEMLDFAVHGMLEVIELNTEAFGEVEVIIIPGNHDWHVTHALTRILDAYYRKNDRVKVHVTYGPRLYHQYGVNLIGFAHGQDVKPTDAPILMATEAKSLWSKTEHHHWHLGHIHRGKKLVYTGFADENGVVVEYLPSIAAPDMWHVEKGYNMSERCLHGITWSKEFGPINRATVFGSEL